MSMKHADIVTVAQMEITGSTLVIFGFKAYVGSGTS